VKSSPAEYGILDVPNVDEAKTPALPEIIDAASFIAEQLTEPDELIAGGRCEQGKLAIVRGTWNRDFLDELSAFPEARHDDQVDSMSAGFSMLSSPSGAITDPKLFIYGNQSGLGRIPGWQPRVFTPRQHSNGFSTDNRSIEEKKLAEQDIYKQRFG
jgi:hypothetical protein